MYDVNLEFYQKPKAHNLQSQHLTQDEIVVHNKQIVFRGIDSFTFSFSLTYELRAFSRAATFEM